MSTDPTPDRAHRATFTVTVTSRADGGHYFDGDDFSAHVAQWIKTDLRGHHAIADVTATAPDQAQQEVRRLGLMVDEYGAGASALTDKLTRVRDMHRETCIAAKGDVSPTAFRCGMCEVLDAPAVLSVLPPDGRAAVLLWAADEIDRRDAEQGFPEDGVGWATSELRRLAAGERDEQQTQQGECAASTSGNCLREAESETACDTEAGECVHGGRPADEARQQPDGETPAACTCGSAGDAFVPAGHYADCPSPEARQQHSPAAAPVAGQPPADTGEEAQPRLVRVCIACPECDHTLDENGACENGCRTKGADRG